MKYCLSIIAAVLFTCLHAQPAQSLIRVDIKTDKPDAVYQVSEKVFFKIQVLKNGHPLKNIKINYQVGPERITPFLQKEETIQADAILVNSEMQVPGFLRCIASVTIDGKLYRGVATAAIDAEKIQPVVTNPEDFDLFWKNAMSDLAKTPLDVKVIPAYDKSTDKVQVSYVNIQNVGGSRLYGTLCSPKSPGKYPAIVNLPGAGIRPYGPDLEMAEKGFVVLSIGIHGIPVNMEPQVYSSLEAGALKGYFLFNPEHRDRYYYKRVYLGCIRSIDFLSMMPEVDTAKIAVTGNSQGGALSIVTAALDKRVKVLAAIHPALCDLPAYLSGRAGGWPHFFQESNLSKYDAKVLQQSLAYYDVVNFAKRLNVPGLYTWGFNDETCPPSSMYAAFNSIKAPKELALYVETGHWFYPEQKAGLNLWLIHHLK
jgi:cephalosporin-C deacetylase-like acetyl esterase